MPGIWVTMVPSTRASRVPFLGAAALRLLFATIDPRRSLHTQLLFQRPAGDMVRGHS